MAEKIKKSKKAQPQFCLPVSKEAKTGVKSEKGYKNFLKDKKYDSRFRAILSLKTAKIGNFGLQDDQKQT